MDNEDQLFNCEEEEEGDAVILHNKKQSQKPKIEVSKLAGNDRVNVKKDEQPSKQERMKILREQKKTKFEEMRLKARNAVKNIGISSHSGVGPMGPIKSFGQLQDSIMKMRENFDFMVLGNLGVLHNQLAMSPTASGRTPNEVEDDSCC